MASAAPSEVLRALTTVSEMLRDRGCDFDAVAGPLSTASLQRIVEGLSDGTVKSVSSIDLPECGVRVVLNLNVKFKVADIKKLIDDEGFSSFVLVVREKLTSVARNSAAMSEAIAMRDVGVFHLRELQYNPTRHSLVPKHEPIRDEAEIQAVMQRYRLKSRYQLPLILSSDPIARYLALSPGQLVCITRTSPSAGTYVLYRCCQRAV
jgi:DNA-directed RNA polymerase subunit H (RpoH/RPB5)